VRAGVCNTKRDGERKQTRIPFIFPLRNAVPCAGTFLRGPKRDLDGGQKHLVAPLMAAERQICSFKVHLPTHFSMGCRENVGVLMYIFCNSTHFAMERSENITVLKLQTWILIGPVLSQENNHATTGF
jgi:hypothetical protein